MSNEQQIECRMYVTKIYFPKGEVEPGKWASFQAEISAVLLGEVQQQRHGKENHIMVFGRVPSLQYGKPYYLHAALKKHPTYGDQYEVIRMETVKELTDPFEQRSFLEQILTENKVNLLYECLENPYRAIQNGDVSALTKIPGIGIKTANELIHKFEQAFDVGGAYGALAEYGITQGMMDKMIETLGSAETLLGILQTNPYRLIEEVDGVGWSRADTWAVNCGLNPNAPERVQAYIIFTLKQLSTFGDTWTTPAELVQKVKEDLGANISDDEIRDALYKLQQRQTIYWTENKRKIGLTRLHDLEVSIAKELGRLMNCSLSEINTSDDCTETLQRIAEEQGWEYIDEQLEAIRLARLSPVSIVTGVAGSGKSSVVYGVLKSFPEKSKVAQTALSGRAASRLGELTKSSGTTIHRLLGYQHGGGYIYTKENPLPYDIVVIDEVSMVGAELFLDLIQAIPSGAKLVMLGDDGQLESIGLCNIFKDMLDAGTIPVARLTKIHRQAQRSAIKTEALKVRTATPLVPKGWIGVETRGELQDLTLNLHDNRILTRPHALQIYNDWIEAGIPAQDIQIVVPMRARGEISARNLSCEIQEVVNPSHPSRKEAEMFPEQRNESAYILREGDLVIATVNNYQTLTTDGAICPIYNGNRGTIISIDDERREMIVDFDQWGLVRIPKAKWRSIELAYALTCHKLQGSEAPYIIIAVDYSGYTLLTREWLYTAITRARKHCTICAETNALQYCITHTNVPFKRTRLKEFLSYSVNTLDKRKETVI